jgi:catechol 2,3-dioxygenase-like lactoylglutathione lyase family enzyme
MRNFIGRRRSATARWVALLVAFGCDSSSAKPDAAGVGGAGGSGSPRPTLSLCSGCPSEMRDMLDSGVRVHHVHLNVKDARETSAFYAKFFDTKEVWLNERETALYADPILILMTEVDHELAEPLQMGLEHVGLGVLSPEMWYAERGPQGLMIDTRNGAPAVPQSMPTIAGSSPFLDPEVDTFAYVYVRGPNNERIEVWSGLKRFRHVHFMTSDIDRTVDWYSKLLGIAPLAASAADGLGFGNGIELDDAVQLFYASTPAIDMFVPTDDRPVSHIGFSVTALDRKFEQAQQLGITVVSPPALTEHGFRSFFLRGPQEVLLEFVEAGPVHVP